MTMSTDSRFQIDDLHARAICDEIGDRLRIHFGRTLGPIPMRLQSLMDRLTEQDRDLAPSIVPSLEDMVWQPEEAHVARRLSHAA
jgi:hypothetical protein